MEVRWNLCGIGEVHFPKWEGLISPSPHACAFRVHVV